MLSLSRSFSYTSSCCDADCVCVTTIITRQWRLWMCLGAQRFTQVVRLEVETNMPASDLCLWSEDSSENDLQLSSLISSPLNRNTLQTSVLGPWPSDCSPWATIAASAQEWWISWLQKAKRRRSHSEFSSLLWQIQWTSLNIYNNQIAE